MIHSFIFYCNKEIKFKIFKTNIFFLIFFRLKKKDTGEIENLEEAGGIKKGIICYY